MDHDATKLREIAFQVSQNLRIDIQDIAEEMVGMISDRLGSRDSFKDGKETDQFALVRQEVENLLSQYFHEARVSWLSENVI